jgi:hypothetical protein
LFLWQRFSDVIHRYIMAAGLRYRYPRKPKLKAMARSKVTYHTF